MIFELFRSAIAQRKPVTFIYQGLYREVCPHALGFKHGRGHVLAFQFGGESSNRLPPGGEWRCFDVSLISNIKYKDCIWHTDESTIKQQRCMDEVIFKIIY